jgi:hypothetical protein
MARRGDFAMLAGEMPLLVEKFPAFAARLTTARPRVH